MDTFFHLELTDRCNLKCEFCSAGDSDKKNIADFDMAVHILDVAKNVSLDGIYMNDVQLNGWGEPLLYPRLGEIIIEAKKRFPKVHFITNGFGLTDEKIDECLNAGLDYICISMTGITDDVYSKFQGSGISMERCHRQLQIVIANIKRLCKKKDKLDRPFKIIIRYIKSDESSKQVKEFIEFWRGTGVDEIQITPLFDFKRDRKKGKFKVLRCSMVPRRYHVAANGELFPCNCNYNKSRNYMGNVYETPFEDLIHTEKFLNERKARESCDLSIVPQSCITCEYRCYKSFWHELKYRRERIFLQSTWKTFIYRFFGIAVVIFERATRIGFIYNIWLMYIRKRSEKIHNKFLSYKKYRRKMGKYD